jgi:hypothetical protein
MIGYWWEEILAVLTQSLGDFYFMATKYILIQNDGEIESNSFELIGASTKRGDSTKIGFFGSGLKYSIAYMMRKGIGFRIFSGEKEMIFTTKRETLKDQEFERICINGNETSFTTTMGPTWTQDWFVLREIYCNAIDEQNCQLVKSTDTVNPSSGKTRIYIEITEPLCDVSNNWDAYFADERTPLFTSEDMYTCFLGHEDNSITRQQVSVYPKTEGVLFRKGIRVYSNKKLLYDYGCEGININEDRTAKNPSGIHYGIYNMAASLVNEGYVKSILRSAQDDEKAEEYFALQISDNSNYWSTNWVQFSKEHLLVVKEHSGKYADEISSSKKELFLIPYSFAKEMKKYVPDVVLLGMGKVVDGVVSSEVELTPKMNFLLKEVVASLKEMKYDVSFEIKVVEFEDEDIMGRANLKDREILIASSTFDKGRREIALVLMEETEHIISQKGDETRSFQNHIFSQWLKTMEDNNGLFL